MADSGDRLARGARSASFQVANNESEFVHDLKTLGKGELIEKYYISEEDYAKACWQLENLKPIEAHPLRVRPIEHSPLVEMPVKATVTIPEAPRYRGMAKGDNVLVIRVEREHSAMLIIPESARAKSDIGRVVSVGPAVTRCEEGELILFDRFAAHGKEIDLVDEQDIPRQHLLLNDVDVLIGLTRLMPRPAETDSDPATFD